MTSSFHYIRHTHFLVTTYLTHLWLERAPSPRLLLPTPFLCFISFLGFPWNLIYLHVNVYLDTRTQVQAWCVTLSAVLPGAGPVPGTRQALNKHGWLMPILRWMWSYLSIRKTFLEGLLNAREDLNEVKEESHEDTWERKGCPRLRNRRHNGPEAAECWRIVRTGKIPTITYYRYNICLYYITLQPIRYHHRHLNSRTYTKIFPIVISM